MGSGLSAEAVADHLQEIVGRVLATGPGAVLRGLQTFRSPMAGCVVRLGGDGHGSRHANMTPQVCAAPYRYRSRGHRACSGRFRTVPAHQSPSRPVSPIQLRVPPGDSGVRLLTYSTGPTPLCTTDPNQEDPHAHDRIGTPLLRGGPEHRVWHIVFPSIGRLTASPIHHSYGSPKISITVDGGAEDRADILPRSIVDAGVHPP